MGGKALWAHQEQAIKRAESLPHFGLFFEVGTGKTRTCIEIIKQKNKSHGRTLRTLILAPAVVTFNWKKEFAQYSNLPNEHVIVLHGTGLERLRQIERTPTYFVIVCNYESLLMDTVFAAIKSWAPEVVVADESHRIKNPRAQRTKRAIAVSTLARYRYILSGTPILQNQSDLFAQYLFLDHGKTLGKNFFTFRSLYFTDKNADLRKKNRLVTWPNWVPKKGKEDEFQNKILSIAMAVKKSECLDLPPYIRQTVEVDMNPDQWKAYKQMRDDYITFVNSKAFTAQLAITKALRLQQIVSGFIMGDEGKVHVFENTPREKALMDLLEDITPSAKVIVWACWRENHASIRKLLIKSGIGFRELLGDSGALQRAEAIQDFYDKPDVRVILGSQAAGGIGISLIPASHAIYFSRNFSLEHDVQSEARNFRGGSEIHKSIHRVDLITPGTIDESISDALAKKQEISEKIIGGGIVL